MKIKLVIALLLLVILSFKYFYDTNSKITTTPNKDAAVLVLIPIEIETLIPINRESIWQTNCVVHLSLNDSEDWKNILFSSKKTSTQFSADRVRVGFKYGNLQAYVDADAMTEVKNGADLSNGQLDFSDIKKRIDHWILNACKNQN